MTHPRSHSKSGPQSPPSPPLHWPTGSSLLGYFPHIESGCSLPSRLLTAAASQPEGKRGSRDRGKSLASWGSSLILSCSPLSASLVSLSSYKRFCPSNVQDPFLSSSVVYSLEQKCLSI